ncbi:hypothetical protein TcasGA2_TC009651 [Tribolium castaneum]|uniref:CHK kinase-like domain-containing protein n=1 Tax=Tribolium castaneum TaxID=7070 RepID=D6WTG6_TRICA|nr:PREDICTED: uncharacterized protein LOC662997 [Tribolium castaneum]EFA06720.1 hypothetical protein TcasGA2_TC009651 [Tribolium castaneum]|eukprot:XP_015836996.1 PREDICTED: uncharacterized protein LOC662997 [Tribolium castaneum]
MNYNEREIKAWLESCFKNLTQIVVTLVGHSEKGDGYMGDIFFVHIDGKNGGTTESYDLAVKSSKDSDILREFSPMKVFFNNEKYFYESVFPNFVQFQTNRGLKNPFKGVPKCYGTLSGVKDVLVFENLTKSGYCLWDRKKPMTRDHVELVIRDYAKFHAVSVALKDQEPQNFEKLVKHYDIFNDLGRDSKNPMLETLQNAVEEMHDLLQNDLDQLVLQKWRNLKNSIQTFFREMLSYEGFKVITHGDCWNNNFLFFYDENDNPIKVSIIDWQISRLASPILDLSHFIFSCTSENDLDDLTKILEHYHKCFTSFLAQLGSSESLYPKNQFFDDWANLSKFGIMFSSIVMKVCTAEKEEAPDLAKPPENGQFTAFQFEVANKKLLKQRMRAIVSCAAKNKLI